MSKTPKKTAKKKPAAAGSYRPDKKTKSVPADFRRHEREAKMSDQDQDQAATIEALRARVAELEGELANEKEGHGELIRAHETLLAELEQAEDAAADGKPGENVQPITGRRYIRGKLPGDKLIRIDTLTGTHKLVSADEWNQIPSGAGAVVSR